MDDATDPARRPPLRGAHLGAAVLLLLCLVMPAAVADEAYPFVAAWGGLGTGTGQFNYSWGIGSDTAGHIYVADFYNHRIQKFTSTGTFITAWGGYGTGHGQLRRPTGVAVDAAGNVYVADHYNHRIQKFTSGGTFITAWGGYGSEPGKMTFPYGVGVDRAGNVYVADYYNHRVQKFTSTGAFLAAWGTRGTGDNQFTFPCGVAVDRNGTIYVADQYNHRVQVLAPDGAFIATMGGDGNGTGQMHYPTHVAFDAAGNVLVADHGNHRIQVYTPSRVLVTTWGTRGSGPGQFESPTAIALDGAGYVYVADTNNNRVQKFAGPGGTLTPTPTPTATPTPTPMPQAPYGPHDLPCRVQAEDYDLGGEGVAYHDAEPANLGGVYRPAEGVDMETAGGVTDVGWTRDGEYLEYSVDTGAGGDFALRLRAANPDPETKPVRVYLDDVPAGNVSIGPTGGWADYAGFDVSAPIAVPAGRHVLTLAFEGVGRVNLDWLDLLAFEPGPRPYRPVTLPGTFEAEEFDLGGEGVAYHDTSAGNSGGASCRTAEDVDLVALDGGGYAVGGVEDGEWLAYTVEGTTDGGGAAPYPVELYLGSDRDGRSVAVEVDGTVVRTVRVPRTGSPTNFTPVLTQFGLPPGDPPGRHTIRLVFQGDGIGLDRIVVWGRNASMYADGWAQPQFTANRSNGTAPLAVQFTDRSSEWTYGWHWDFGDGGPLSAERDPVRTFPLPGVYTVRLTTDEEDHWFIMSGPNGTRILGWFHHLYAAQTAELPITVEPPIRPVPPGGAGPLDGDGDGRYEDVNGNGRPDFADVVLYFNQMDWIAANEPLPAFDYNANDRIDFADVVWLFNRL